MAGILERLSARLRRHGYLSVAGDRALRRLGSDDLLQSVPAPAAYGDKHLAVYCGTGTAGNLYVRLGAARPAPRKLDMVAVAGIGSAIFGNPAALVRRATRPRHFHPAACAQPDSAG